MPTRTGVRGAYERTSVPKPKTQTHEEIVEALQVHAGLVIQSVTRILGNVHEAEDVAQDLAEKLLRSPPRDVRSWPALLKTMAVNAAIDRVRRRRNLDDMPELSTTEGPEAAMTAAQSAAALRRAVGLLSRRDATLFSLFYLADLSQADIARQLDMTASAVGVALHRARKRLGDLLDPSFRHDDAGAS